MTDNKKIGKSENMVNKVIQWLALAAATTGERKQRERVSVCHFSSPSVSISYWQEFQNSNVWKGSRVSPLYLHSSCHYSQSFGSSRITPSFYLKGWFLLWLTNKKSGSNPATSFASFDRGEFLLLPKVYKYEIHKSIRSRDGTL